MFSVALSVGSHRPGVTWRPALRSPDFPLPDWDGANQRRPLGLTAIARLTPAATLPQKSGFAPRCLGSGVFAGQDFLQAEGQLVDFVLVASGQLRGDLGALLQRQGFQQNG